MNPKTTKQLTAPTDEPVSLSEVKAHLRIESDFDDDDSMLEDMIAAARRLVESRLGHSLMLAQYRSTFAKGAVFLQLTSPLVVNSTQTLSLTIDGSASTDFERDDDASELELGAAAAGKVVVTHWAGAASAADVAPQIKAALLLYVGHLYANREATTTDKSDPLPMAFETLLASQSERGSW